MHVWCNMASAKGALEIVAQHQRDENQQDILKLAECKAAKDANLAVNCCLLASVVSSKDAMCKAELACLRWLDTHGAVKAYKRDLADYAAVSIVGVKLSHSLYATLLTTLSTGIEYVTARPQYDSLRTVLCTALNTAKDATKDAADDAVKEAKDAKVISASAAKAAAKDAKDAKILANKLGTENALYVANIAACSANNVKKNNIRCACDADYIIREALNPFCNPYSLCTRNIDAFAADVSNEASRTHMCLTALSNDTYDDYAETNYAYLTAHIVRMRAEYPNSLALRDYIAHGAANAENYWSDESADNANALHLAVDKFTANATVLSIVAKASPSGIAQTALSIVAELAWLDAFEAPQRAADAAQHAAEVAQSAANLLAKAYKIPCMAYPEPVNRERRRQSNYTLGQNMIDKAFHRATDAAKLATDAAKLAAKRTAQHSKGAAE